MQTHLAIKKLDKTLIAIKQLNNPNFENLKDYLESNETAFEEIELRRTLKQLIDDKYIHSENYYYYLSIKGALFLGYEHQEKVNERNELLAEAYKRRALRNEKSLRFGTWTASIVGALVLLWYVFVYFHPQPSGCSFYYNYK